MSLKDEWARKRRPCPDQPHARHAQQWFRFSWLKWQVTNSLAVVDLLPAAAGFGGLHLTRPFFGANSRLTFRRERYPFPDDDLRRRSFPNGVRPVSGHRRLPEHRQERSRSVVVPQACDRGDAARAHG